MTAIELRPTKLRAAEGVSKSLKHAAADLDLAARDIFIEVVDGSMAVQAHRIDFEANAFGFLDVLGHVTLEAVCFDDELLRA